MKPIPYYVDPPALSPSAIEEISLINFGDPIHPEPCDVILIFGGSHPGLWENGALAYINGYGRDIIVTGGNKPTAIRHPTWKYGNTSESAVIQQGLVGLGVPEDVIFSEDQSTNTFENVRFAMESYDFYPVSSVLVVCKNYAVGRQTRTLRAQLSPDSKIIPYPFDTHLGGSGPYITRENWMSHPEALSYMFANLLKIVQYGRAGHLEPVDYLSDELDTIVQDFLDNDE